MKERTTTFREKRLHPRDKFTPDEDMKIKKLVQKYGENDWKKVAAKMKGRNVRQCRERWKNYLSPSIDWSAWSEEEDKLLIEKYRELGPKWKILSTLFQKRTEIIVKNRMNKILRKINKGKYRNNLMSEFSSSLDHKAEKKNEIEDFFHQLDVEYQKLQNKFAATCSISTEDWDSNFDLLFTPEFVV